MAQANRTNRAPRKSRVVQSQIEKGDLIVWLKSRAYISDTERLDGGVYMMKQVPERLSKLSADVCEVFENEVSSKKVAQMSRWAGLNPDGLSDEEVLGKIVSEPQPFL
jgi:hypothetical protein